ncbi:MAG: hypothetical protein F6K40_33825 [Okeania sp. SIO3I5]|nr:hypothetical protein [Okeania sp. SIO3I5]NEQ40929.1 hypothetical protein [Okeania sp. SIO3I5]
MRNKTGKKSRGGKRRSLHFRKSLLTSRKSRYLEKSLTNFPLPIYRS